MIVQTQQPRLMGQGVLDNWFGCRTCYNEAIHSTPFENSASLKDKQWLTNYYSVDDNVIAHLLCADPYNTDTKKPTHDWIELLKDKEGDYIEEDDDEALPSLDDIEDDDEVNDTLTEAQEARGYKRLTLDEKINSGYGYFTDADVRALKRRGHSDEDINELIEIHGLKSSIARFEYGKMLYTDVKYFRRMEDLLAEDLSEMYQNRLYNWRRNDLAGQRVGQNLQGSTVDEEGDVFMASDFRITEEEPDDIISYREGKYYKNQLLYHMKRIWLWTRQNSFNMLSICVAGYKFYVEGRRGEHYWPTCFKELSPYGIYNDSDQRLPDRYTNPTFNFIFEWFSERGTIGMSYRKDLDEIIRICDILHLDFHKVDPLKFNAEFWATHTVNVLTKDSQMQIAKAIDTPQQLFSRKEHDLDPMGAAFTFTQWINSGTPEVENVKKISDGLSSAPNMRLYQNWRVSLINAAKYMAYYNEMNNQVCTADYQKPFDLDTGFVSQDGRICVFDAQMLVRGDTNHVSNIPCILSCGMLAINIRDPRRLKYVNVTDLEDSLLLYQDLCDQVDSTFLVRDSIGTVDFNGLRLKWNDI